MANHYQTLGVKESASTNDINTAYRKLMRRYHPDINSGADELAALVTHAYSVLSDNQKRREYDRTLYTPVPNLIARNPEPVIKVAKPTEFTQPNQRPARARSKRAGFLSRALSTVGGKSMVILSAISLVIWISSILVGLNNLGGIPLGLSSFTVGLFILTVSVFFVNPIKHPWVSIVVLILAFAIPIDYIHGDNLLPKLLTGLNMTAAICVVAAYAGSIGVKLFWSNARKIASVQ